MVQVIFVFIISLRAFAIEDARVPCESFDAFKETYEFLEQDQELYLAPRTSIQIALEVSRGCKDAGKRFKNVFNLLKKTGVDYKKSVELAMQFAILDNQRTENFIEIFQKTYLDNYFNFDFTTSFQITYELSKELKDHPQHVRNDFIKLTQFCMKAKDLTLTVAACARMVLQLIKVSNHYPSGIYKSFEEAFYFSKVELKMGLSDSLKTTLKILENGPLGFENFKKTYEYVDKKFNFKKKQSIGLSHEVASHSLTKSNSAEESISIKASR